jgi:hypothetical protein
MDMLFLRDKKLSYSQMIVLYYLMLLKNWVKYSEDEHYVILSTKIEKDLKLHPKTIEASITKLKKLQLITIKRIVVDKWDGPKKFRAIAITPIGKEFNMGYVKESEHQNSVELAKENEEFRVENDSVNSKNLELEIKNSDLEFKNKALELMLEADRDRDKLLIEGAEAIERVKEIQKEQIILKREYQILQEELNMKEVEEKDKKSKSAEKQEKDMDTFRKKITKEHAQSGKAICNAVQNQDNWSAETKFHINSYNRLSIYLPNGEAKQISDPKQVDFFWVWLFFHQHRVKNLLNTNIKANISSLRKFEGKPLKINNQIVTVYRLDPLIAGVKVTLLDREGKLTTMGNGYGSKIIDVERCKKFFDLYSKKDITCSHTSFVGMNTKMSIVYQLELWL